MGRPTSPPTRAPTAPRSCSRAPRRKARSTIYTSATVDDMTALTTAFQKKYGVKTQVWRASSENIIQRAATEARGNRFDVDVFETDGVAMEAMHREKLLQEVQLAAARRPDAAGDPPAQGMDRRPRPDLHRRLQHPRDQEGRPAEDLRRSHQSEVEGQARHRGRRPRLVLRRRRRRSARRRASSSSARS